MYAPHTDTGSLITQFGYYGDGRDILTVSTDRYYQLGLPIFCTPRNRTHSQADWFFSDGTRIEVGNRNRRVGHHSNGTAVLLFAEERYRLSYCDAGMYTCIVTSTTGLNEARNFTLIINGIASCLNT